jgi:hypothetical protein
MIPVQRGGARQVRSGDGERTYSGRPSVSPQEQCIGQRGPLVLGNSLQDVRTDKKPSTCPYDEHIVGWSEPCTDSI